MLTVAAALASAACWGVADFAGGLRSRRSGAVAVLVAGQVTGLLLVGAAAAAAGGAIPPVGELWPAMLAALAGLVGLGALYRGLATGTMSIVAPISATGAAVPVVFGIATGESPSEPALAGIALAVAGVVLASREAAEHELADRVRRTAVGLALLAAAGFGIFFVGIDAAADEAGVLWALVAARAVSAPVVLAVAIATRSLPRRSDGLGVLAGIGALDVAANALFAVAAAEGMIAVAAVLSSLYPLFTVALARTLLGERVRRVQEVGIAAALAGVVLIGAFG